MTTIYTVELDVCEDPQFDPIEEVAFEYNIQANMLQEFGPAGGNPVYEFISATRETLEDFISAEFGDEDDYYKSLINEVEI